jgi:DNA repair protein RecO (recombination protein O)
MFKGYVLHTSSYRETSLIVKFFTKEHGIVNLIANGAKRKKSQFAAILHGFIPLSLYWKRHNAELALLYKAETHGPPYRLTSKYLFSALYINELLVKLLISHDPQIELFDLYEKFLQALSLHNKANKIGDINNSEQEQSQQIFLQQQLRSMEKNILKAMGYALQLDRESQTGHLVDYQQEYYFDFDNGVTLYNPQELQLFSNKITGKALLALHHDNLTELTDLKQAKLFMRQILANFLGNKSLITRKLFI